MKAESVHLEIWQEVLGFRQRYRSENKFCQVWKSPKHGRITLLLSTWQCLPNKFLTIFLLNKYALITVPSVIRLCVHQHMQEINIQLKVEENRGIFPALICSGLSLSAWIKRWESASLVASTSLIKRNYERLTPLIQICGGFGMEKTLDS